MLKIKKDEKIKKVLEFLKKNTKATHADLKKAGYTHIERLFSMGLKEAYSLAEIKFPRTFEKKSKEERRKIIIDYIKKNPKAGGQTIAKDTKINVKNAFNNIEEAFEAAGVYYPRWENIILKKRTKKKRIEDVINLVKNKPETTFEDISKELKLNPFKLFRNFNEIYRLADMKYISGTHKRALKKKKIIIEYIQNNPSTTQREINKKCHTRIQGLFDKGIFGAYKEANIDFPFERLKLHGSAIDNIKQRANNFEGEIARKLSCYGTVSRLIPTKRGVADIILERKDKKIIIEVKDYLNKEISIHEIKQLNKYLEDCNCNIGFLICHKKPKKDKFLIGKNKIIVLGESEIDKIPSVMDGN